MTDRAAPATIWEFYELLKGIEGDLAASGAKDWATRLANTVAGGSTSGEILTYIGVDLDQLVASGLPQRLGLCPEVDLARAFARQALKSAGQPDPPPCM